MSKKGMIEPFEVSQIRSGISFGPSSYGYDFRLGKEFKIFTPLPGAVMDPKKQDPKNFTDFTGDVCEIPPHGFVLGQTLEYFRIPRNILTICFGKSTYARSGVHLNVTPCEPEWEGYITMAIHNHTACPARIYAREGVGQLLFFEAEDICEISYADKKGKYQAQKNITTAKGSG